MSEPSNGAWPFQEIPEEEGLDISAIFGDSSAAPQGDPFAPPAAAQSVPSSPTPVAQEITPAVAATSQPTTAPIAKAPVEAPAENPIAAAFEQKTAENTKKGLLEKPPVRSPLWTRPDGVGLSSTPGRCGERKSRQAAPSAVTMGRGNII